MESFTTSALIFVALIANAFSKIMIMLLGVIIAFLAIPQSRAAAMLGIAIISAFAGGILIEVYSVERSWTTTFAMSLSFGAGFMVYPFLTFFRKFNNLVSKDDEIVELLYNKMKSYLKKSLAEDKK